MDSNFRFPLMIFSRINLRFASFVRIKIFIGKIDRREIVERMKENLWISYLIVELSSNLNLHWMERDTSIFVSHYFVK